MKIILKRVIKLFLVLPFVYLLSGCANYLEPFKTSPATLGTPTATNKELKSLPLPQEKIVAAVYKFRDQTGQYKQSSTGTTFSTAVTQGATSILLRALEESGWFIPIEREGLSNLLNERKIIRSSRSTFGTGEEDNTLLPPLLFAGVILEGGIISYDTNVLTGGAGIRYFGAGASGQYRQDRVTIYLRAISTQSGRILKTVYTSKTVLSQMVDIGLFRFVKFKRLLEAETGFSYNEPPEICVTEAIEKAVHSLIVEGVLEGLWDLKYTEDLKSPAILGYVKEKEMIQDTDYFGNILIPTRGIGIGVTFNAQMYSGDYFESVVKPAGSLSFKYAISNQLSTGLTLSSGQLSDGKFFTTTLNSAELTGIYHLLPQYYFTPYLTMGVGVSNLVVKDRYGTQLQLKNEWAPSFSGGIGFEYLVYDLIGLNLGFSYTYYFNDEIDGLSRGNLNDYMWAGKVGLTFYPGR